MSITVQETEATSATVIFVPADNNEPYSYGVIAKEEFYNGFIPPDVNDMSRCMKAVYSHTFEDLESETEYVVYAYGVDGSGNYVAGRLESAEFTTLEKPVESTFGVTVDNMTPGKVDVHIDTKDYSSTYFYGCITKEEYDACADDKAIYDAYNNSYTGEEIPVEEYCWYDYFDMFNYYIEYVDLSWIFENAVGSGEITYQENKARQQQDTVMYVYAIAVDGQYCMPRQSKASVFEIDIPGYGGDL